MPEISRFFGIIMAMYYNDHAPPHFHAKYGSMRACFSISDLRLIEGELPHRVVMLVLEWAFEHRKELQKNWNLSENRAALKKIAPLEVGVLGMRWIKDVKYLEDGYILELCFDNDEWRRVDLQKHLVGEIFEPLRDLSYFRQVVANKDIDTVVWPNDADFSPDFLYEISNSLSRTAKRADNKA